MIFRWIYACCFFVEKGSLQCVNYYYVLNLKKFRVVQSINNFQPSSLLLLLCVAPRSDAKDTFFLFGESGLNWFPFCENFSTTQCSNSCCLFKRKLTMCQLLLCACRKERKIVIFLPLSFLPSCFVKFCSSCHPLCPFPDDDTPSQEIVSERNSRFSSNTKCHQGQTNCAPYFFPPYAVHPPTTKSRKCDQTNRCDKIDNRW